LSGDVCCPQAKFTNIAVELCYLIAKKISAVKNNLPPTAILAKAKTYACMVAELQTLQRMVHWQ